MGYFELGTRVRVVDRQSPFYNYIGEVKQVDEEAHRFTINGRFKGWGDIPVWATFSAGQLELEGRDKIE